MAWVATSAQLLSWLLNSLLCYESACLAMTCHPYSATLGARWAIIGMKRCCQNQRCQLTFNRTANEGLADTHRP